MKLLKMYVNKYKRNRMLNLNKFIVSREAFYLKINMQILMCLVYLFKLLHYHFLEIQ